MEFNKKNLRFYLSAGFLILVNLVFLAYMYVSQKTQEPENNNLNYSEIEEINGKNYDFRQLSNFFGNLAHSKGGEYAYKALALAADKGYITPNSDTHLLGHKVGDILYKQAGIEGMKVCTDDLRNACSHSVVVGAMLDQGPAALSKIVEVCEKAPGGSGAYTMCVHGLGHGVLVYLEYDMRKAVDMCMQTATDKHGGAEAPQCVGGIVMEMVSGVHDEVAWAKQKPNYLVAGDPLAPCDLGFVPSNALPFCYDYLTPRLFEEAGADLGHPDPKYYKQAMSFCLKIPKTDKASRDTCLGSFGKEFVVLANERNVQSVVYMSSDQLKNVYTWCNQGIDEALAPCISSAVQSLFWGGENDRMVSIRFCNVVDKPSDQTTCFASLTGQVAYYIKDQNYRKSYCQEIPETYREDCKKILSL